MFSSRIYDYEAINVENKKGWYTRSDATYLFNYDIAYYEGNYWATINKYRLFDNNRER
ncbi:polysaccharide lyase family 8 super-sandwich domain-containing protein [Cohnella silvisoli]|uniref:polysaccharide lyase family 8 super-sandwich domain-containing protein n=1 Tax=Cohnella silvisoli TaxID=2873699 RepID=UPI0035A166DF|nr:hypothetical protein [Cohnella silvisoli]